MSTGSTEGYGVDNFQRHGSTRWEHGGHDRYYTNHFTDHFATTYTVTQSTIPIGQFSVLRSSTNVTWNLSAAKKGAFTQLCILDATSSGIHTLACTTDYDIIAGGASGLTATIQNAGIIEIYCPSTLLYIVGGNVVGSSDVTATGTS